MDSLAATLRLVKQRIAKHRGDRTFNEQNTKMSLIVPVLQSLGWDTNDSDEVHFEYRHKPRHNPVDFALMSQRTPCLFLEAKALRDPLTDHKVLEQIVTYSSIAGVEWIVLSNGDEFRIYNVSAPVPIEEKLFRTVSISVNSEAELADTLALLSKENLQDKKIERLWLTSFVDRRVKAAHEELTNRAAPHRSIIRAIRAITGDKIKDSEIEASLRRAHFQIDFPVVASAPPIDAKSTRVTEKPRKQSIMTKPDATGSGITIQNLIAEGLIRPPAELFCEFKKHRVSAIIEMDGRIKFGGDHYDSPSAAGGMARKPYHRGTFKHAYPSTNGWTFWSIIDPETKQAVSLDALRRRLIDRRKAEAERFRRSAAG